MQTLVKIKGYIKFSGDITAYVYSDDNYVYVVNDIGNIIKLTKSDYEILK